MPTASLNLFGSFSGTGISVEQRAQDGEFNLDISGTWTGTIELQRNLVLSTGVDNWDTVEIFTGTSVPTDDIVAKTGSHSGTNISYRLEATTLGAGEAFFKLTQ